MFQEARHDDMQAAYPNPWQSGPHKKSQIVPALVLKGDSWYDYCLTDIVPSHIEHF